MTLTTDTYSTRRELYGKRGDKIKLISNNHHPVLIVQNQKGERFPVRVENVKVE